LPWTKRTIQEHSSRAEELAAEAVRYLGRGNVNDTAAISAAVAQVYATLALAAAIETAAISRGRPQVPIPGVTPPVTPEPGLPGVRSMTGLDP
jgi:hypothetical protein